MMVHRSHRRPNSWVVFDSLAFSRVILSFFFFFSINRIIYPVSRFTNKGGRRFSFKSVDVSLFSRPLINDPWDCSISAIINLPSAHFYASPILDSKFSVGKIISWKFIEIRLIFLLFPFFFFNPSKSIHGIDFNTSFRKSIHCTIYTFIHY